MTASLLAQYAVIVLAVLLSTAYVVRRQFPAGVRRMRLACALPLVRDGRSPWLQQLGRYIAPAPLAAESECGGCNNCGPRKA